MSDRSGIEWTDATWNPVTGCAKVSAGCDHCYAETLHERFNGPGSFATVTLHPDRLDKPLRWRKPKRVFVNSMSDLFHDDVPDEYIARVFAVMALADQHTFQLLTKRHGRMRSLLNSDGFRLRVRRLYLDCDRPDGLTPGRCSCGHANGSHNELAYCQHVGCSCGVVGFTPWDRWPLPNVWLGVSVENQQWADIRIPALLGTPAAVRFLSCEPLLGPVDLGTYLRRWETCETCGGSGSVAVPGGGAQCTQCCGGEHPTGPRAIDWVIVGGESGRDARPMHPGWARSLRDQCQTADIPFLFKQWGEWVTFVKGETPRTQHGDHEVRVGKKAAGRELDGRTWDEFPKAVTPHG